MKVHLFLVNNNMAEIKQIHSRIDKAIFEYNMIEDGDRILIGVSGGKDSTLLVKYFSNRMKRKSVNFSYEALYIHSDFASPFPLDVKNLYSKWNVPLNTIDCDVLNRLKKNEKMSCWWCSCQRRTELLNYAIKNGFNKIALGHHMDDILETFIMNMMNKGNLSTMIPLFKYNKYPITVIRPLCYIPETMIIDYMNEKGYSKYTCTCSYQDNSGRKESRRLLALLTENNQQKKEIMFKSLQNVQSEYLP